MELVRSTSTMSSYNTCSELMTFSGRIQILFNLPIKSRRRTSQVSHMYSSKNSTIHSMHRPLMSRRSSRSCLRLLNLWTRLFLFRRSQLLNATRARISWNSVEWMKSLWRSLREHSKNTPTWKSSRRRELISSKSNHQMSSRKQLRLWQKPACAAPGWAQPWWAPPSVSPRKARTWMLPLRLRKCHERRQWEKLETGWLMPWPRKPKSLKQKGRMKRSSQTEIYP